MAEWVSVACTVTVVAGFSGSSGDYFLGRAACESPYVLQKQLWPWIEEWEARFEARARRQRWAQGGLDDDDLAADGFVKLLRRLRTVLLQDLAVLQPRYPSLPFFNYAPFYGPDWDEFALVVRSHTAAGEPPSLLLQRALPEVSAALQSSRDAIVQNSSRLANGVEQRLEGRLRSLQGSVDALLQGRIPINLTGYFGPAPTDESGGVRAAGTPTASSAPPAPAPAPLAKPGLPVFTALAKAFTVEDVWKEWKEGFAGRPAVRELEEKWGSRWRPGNAIRVQFCRRKVIWDELVGRIARGKSEDEAVAELELLRAGRRLNQLADDLRQRRQRGQQPLPPPPPLVAAATAVATRDTGLRGAGAMAGGDAGHVQQPPPAPATAATAAARDTGLTRGRGHGRRRRWARYGRRGGLPGRLSAAS